MNVIDLMKFVIQQKKGKVRFMTKIGPFVKAHHEAQMSDAIKIYFRNWR